MPTTVIMFRVPGRDTLPDQLLWASFAFVYVLARWGRATTWAMFAVISVITGIPLIKHVASGTIGWEESSEIILMGIVVGLLVWHVNRDLAAERQIAALLGKESTRAANRELTTRLGSHELRTRLSIANGFAQLIRDNANDTSTRADAQLIVTELDKATVLATNLMTLVRADTPSTFRRFDLDELIDSVGRRWFARSDRPWVVSSSVGVMWGDPERLEVALDCLMENAVKFSADGDPIGLDARLDDEYVVIAVQDAGLGIPEDDLEHVSELFHTSGNAGARAGSGLGLSIVRTVIEASGGSLTLTSTLGSGTCAVMRMPRGLYGPAPQIPTAQRAVTRAGEDPRQTVDADRAR